MLVSAVLIIIRLDGQSKFQMFTLFSGNHIGVLRMSTNMAFSYWRNAQAKNLEKCLI